MNLTDIVTEHEGRADSPVTTQEKTDRATGRRRREGSPDSEDSQTKAESTRAQPSGGSETVRVAGRPGVWGWQGRHFESQT